MRGLIIGAGEAGRSMARDFRSAPGLSIEPIGFLDDTTESSIGDLPVLGAFADLGTVVQEHRVDVVIITVPSLPSLKLGVPAEATVQVAERGAQFGALDDLRVDLLLGRTERELVGPDCRELLRGKRILVTGASGSIGSELCRQLDRLDPGALYLLDVDAPSLRRLELQLNGNGHAATNGHGNGNGHGHAATNGHARRDRALVIDILDGDAVRRTFDALRPQVVFHAAANKYLPQLEHDPCEGVRANALGTALLARAAVEAGAEQFVLMSSIKAAEPTSILGASKRLAEMVLQHAAGGTTKLASARFGNVLGTRGSLLPLLHEQLTRGNEVSVTDREMSRYFMTLSEAAGLVMTVAAMAGDGEVFALDMGHPVRIVDLVRGYAAQIQRDAVIRYTGRRPGEKLSELVFGHGEQQTPSAHPHVLRMQPPALAPDLSEQLEQLFAASLANRSDEVRSLLLEILPEHRPVPEHNGGPVRSGDPR